MYNQEKLQEVKKLILENNIEFIDLKCTDLIGNLRHVTLPYKEGLLEKLLTDGVGFDGSSYGFMKVENSDMIQIPDLETAVIDPFRQAKTLSFFTHVILTDDARSPYPQDVRNIAKKALKLLQDVTECDQILFGPEFEFYIFSNVMYDTQNAYSYYKVEHAEGFYKNAYHACNPFDVYDDFRDEAVRLFKHFGIDVKYHHHEVGERGQQEIETYFSDMIHTADNIVLAKYILFNLAREKNLFVTFMPKPIFEHAGSGLHVHMFLTKNGKNAFYEKGQYGNMNQLGKYFIGGILKHAPALSAITNPSTNSFKRLVPGFEAPVALTYGMGNRASAIRIPKYVKNPEETRFEYRPPDATANPHLFLTALVLAGIDGVRNKIDPTAEGFGPIDTNVMDESLRNKIKFLPRSLSEALECLENDYEFLIKDDVMDENLIRQWIKVKNEEVKAIQKMPHPYEYKLYFNL